MEKHIDLENLAALEAKAEEAAGLLGAMSNAKRLIVLCNLLAGEHSVGELGVAAGLSQAAVSQHLGRMRAMGLVATRRDGQTIFYRLASDEVRELLATLHRLYCAPACPAGPDREMTAPA